VGTDLRAEQVQMVWDQLRIWIEDEDTDHTCGGRGWEQTNRSEPERARRRGLAMAVAMWWVEKRKPTNRQGDRAPHGERWGGHPRRCSGLGSGSSAVLCVGIRRSAQQPSMGDAVGRPASRWVHTRTHKAARKRQQRNEQGGMCNADRGVKKKRGVGSKANRSGQSVSRSTKARAQNGACGRRRVPLTENGARKRERHVVTIGNSTTQSAHAGMRRSLGSAHAAWHALVCGPHVTREDVPHQSAQRPRSLGIRSHSRLSPSHPREYLPVKNRGVRQRQPNWWDGEQKRQKRGKSQTQLGKVARRLHLEKPACPNRGSLSAVKTPSGSRQPERGGNGRWDAEHRDRDLARGWRAFIPNESFGPAETRVRSRCAGQDHARGGERRSGEWRQAHLNLLVAHELPTVPPMCFPAPLAPEERTRPTSANAGTIHHAQAPSFSALLMWDAFLICRAPKRSIELERTVLAREATGLPCRPHLWRS
jgi:hypothetical protein